MTESHVSSFLTRLPHDVRLEIYSYLTLPPFNGCEDCAGLLLSCRQLKEEVDMEAVRQLRIHLDEASKEKPVESRLLRDLNGGEKINHNGCLDFLPPSTVLAMPEIGVRVPFWLPAIEHDWHQQEYPIPRLGCYLMYDSSRPQYEWEIAKERRDREDRIYHEQITQLLRPIRQLHMLHANISIHLVLDESTSTRVAEDTLLKRELKVHRRRSVLLGCNVLGRLLDAYIGKLNRQAAVWMLGWSEDWAFHTKTVSMTWSFTDRVSPVHQQDRWFHGRTLVVGEGVDNKASCTEDRREGTVQLKFDVAGCAQKELNDLKRHIRRMEMRRRTSSFSPSVQGHDDQDEINMDNEELARLREKLRRIGIEEGPEPVPDELEISSAAILSELEAQRAQGRS